MSKEQKSKDGQAPDPAAQGGAQPLRVEPDLEFVKTVADWGGGDLKTCFQCATCSVVCPLSPDINPFPRKEIIWAQWGLKERLVRDPDLWLCHRCNDCSEKCPRGAKTGDVMAALRSIAYQHNAWPGFLGRMANRPTMLPLLLALPVLVVLGIIYGGGNLAPPAGLNAELSSAYWGNMIEPWPWLDLTFLLAALFAVLSFASSILRLWRGFMSSGVQDDVTPKMSLPRALWCALVDILAHRRFEECGAAHARRWAHLLVLFGFGGLFVTTALVFVGMYLFGLKTPLPLGHWIKVLGNVSAIAISIGLIWIIARRVNAALAVANGRNAYQDVLFLAVLTLVVATGIGAEVLRLAVAHNVAAAMYFLHLVLIFFLIFYAPYSKFAHVVYHATAVTWAHHVGRRLKTLQREERLPVVTAGSDGGGKKEAA